MLQPVGHGGGGGFVDQSQHVQARQMRRVLGGLSLRIVEVGGYRDDRTEHLVVEGVLRPLPQRGQDLCRNLHG